MTTSGGTDPDELPSGAGEHDDSEGDTASGGAPQEPDEGGRENRRD
ncbi:MAG TPA: hypothetical protein VHZ81_15695 [Galbitalea sp.]|jgi:hypothetical protein|nr:hypothetical protein [Galbitalea sp.]